MIGDHRADHLLRTLFDEMGLASQKQEFERDDVEAVEHETPGRVKYRHGRRCRRDADADQDRFEFWAVRDALIGFCALFDII